MTAVVLELVREAAAELLRDPRVHPRVGDVVDDDPPLVPLTVVAVWPSEEVPRRVAARQGGLPLGGERTAGLARHGYSWCRS